VRALLAAFACFALSGCGIPASVWMWAQAKQYSGDGVIYTCSNIFMRGYGIDFPRFDASQPYTASYRLSKVPQTSRKQTGVCLRFKQPDLAMALAKQKSVTATFRLVLYDTDDNILHSADVVLSQPGWSETGRLFSVYAGEKSYVQFERNSSYVLKVSYTPGAVPPPAKDVYFAVENCAFY
jgi:hypothetical protein